MKFLGIILPILSLCALSACATGPLYSANSQAVVPLNSSLARLAIFRRDHLLDSLSAARIEVDGRNIGSINNNSVFFFDHAPGMVTVSADSPTMFGWYKVQVDLQAGKTYYLEVSPNSGVNMSIAGAGLLGYMAESAAQTKDKSGMWSVQSVNDAEAVSVIGQIHDETLWPHS